MIRALLVCACFFGAITGYAQTPVPPPSGNAQPTAPPTTPRAWSSLSPQQQQLLQTYQGKWDSLPADRQQALAKGSQRWISMTPQQRAGAQQRFSQWRAMPPEQRQLVRQRYQQFKALPPERQQEVRDAMKLVPLSTRTRWDNRRKQIINASTAEDFALRRLLFDKSRELVGLMHRARVMLLAGTDAMDTYVLPGSGLHEELELMVEAGLKGRFTGNAGDNGADEGAPRGGAVKIPRRIDGQVAQRAQAVGDIERGQLHRGAGIAAGRPGDLEHPQDLR